VVNRGLKADDLVKSSGIIDKDIAKFGDSEITVP